MCIRDSTTGSAVRIVDGIINSGVTQVQAVLNDGVGVSPFGSVGHIGQGIVSVSYTHLDVYKRQQ